MNQQELIDKERLFIKLKLPDKIEQITSVTDDEINKKYLTGEVRIVTEQARYPLSSIKEMFESDNYILRPDFQRRHRWDVSKQSKLIESFIMNVPIPPVFLYETDYSVYEVMDGMQRITAIRDFYGDKYALQDLEKWPELNGRKYSMLPEQVKKGIDRRYISSIILLKETAKTEDEAASLKRMVFSRINSGGAKLEDQEYRNAQCQGPFNDLIVNLARNDCYCEIFGIPLKTDDENLDNDRMSDELKENGRFKSMKDVENVLRFFALRQIDQWTDSISFSTFLDLFSNAAKDLPDEILAEYKNLFEKTIKLAYDLYDNNAFCLVKKNDRWSKKPATVVYDPLMSALSQFIDESEKLIEKKDDVVEGTKKIICEENLFNGRNTNRSNIKIRMSRFHEFFSGLLK